MGQLFHTFLCTFCTLFCHFLDRNRSLFRYTFSIFHSTYLLFFTTLFHTSLINYYLFFTLINTLSTSTSHFVSSLWVLDSYFYPTTYLTDIVYLPTFLHFFTNFFVNWFISYAKLSYSPQHTFNSYFAVFHYQTTHFYSFKYLPFTYRWTTFT